MKCRFQGEQTELWLESMCGAKLMDQRNTDELMNML